MELFLHYSLLALCTILVDSRTDLELSNEVTHVNLRRGHWAPWRYWAPCSRTCGGGITYRTRSCLIGDRRVASENCEGEYKQYEVCSDQACPDGHTDFRAIQCSMYDELDAYGIVRQWRPMYNVNYNCDLYCEKHVSTSETLSRNMGLVVDGTSCVESTRGRGVCIQGQCRSVGCDGRLNSNVRYDNCGECGGMNRSCGSLSGRFTLELAEEELFHYYDVVTFQPGTTNITVEEASEVNYLALSVGSVYQLNGDWDISRPGTFSAAGALFTYERRRDGYERLTSPGPINTLVQISIIVRSTGPLVTYQFHSPARPVPSPATTHQQALSHHANTIVSNTGVIEEPRIDNCPCIDHDSGGSESVEDSVDKSELTDIAQPGIYTAKADTEKKRERKQEQQMMQQMKELCGPCEKAKGKIRNFCSSDFVVRANILDRNVEFNMTRYDVDILQTFTNQVVLFSREYIWVPNICNCPKMKTGREYLIMGDRVQSRTSRENLLMVDRDKMVVRWKPAQYEMWDSIQATSTAKCDKIRNKQRHKKHMKKSSY